MSDVRSFTRYWLPVLIWMAVIFAASGDRGSYQRSSNIITPIIRWFAPRISDAGLATAVMIVRKGAHVSEYAILAILVWRSLRNPSKGNPRPWSWRESGWVALIVALYAASDEWHQLFVPSREASVRDVLIDLLGGAFGLLCLCAATRWKQRRQQR